MKFEDLLDEDGQGSRRCDAWLAGNIGHPRNVKLAFPRDEERIEYDGLSEKTAVPKLTTSNSIDPIYNLADDYFNIWTFHSHGKYEYSVEPYPHEFETLQLAIAHALFKDYHLNELTEQAQEMDMGYNE